MDVETQYCFRAFSRGWIGERKGPHSLTLEGRKDAGHGEECLCLSLSLSLGDYKKNERRRCEKEKEEETGETFF